MGAADGGRAEHGGVPRPEPADDRGDRGGRTATFEALGKVKGMGPVKVHRYGRAILDLLAGEMD